VREIASFLDLEQPDKRSKLLKVENDPEGTTRSSSGKVVFAGGLLHFILAGFGFLHYWRKGAALKSSS
jgi:hypothetical protein